MVQVRSACFSLSDINIVCDKTLKQELTKLVWEKSGIYMIRNTVSGSCYVGLAKNIYKRITYGHIHDLIRNKHIFSDGQPDLLQKAWNKYGNNAFEYVILEYCPVENLPTRERFWISCLNCNATKSGKGYNLTDGGNFPPTDGRGSKGRKAINNGVIQKRVLLEDLEKYLQEGWILGELKKYSEARSAAQRKQNEERRAKGIKRMVSEETRKKQSEAHYKPGYKSRKKGEYVPSATTREKIGNKHRGIPKSEESNKKRSETMLSKNMHHSQEAKDKIIKSKEKAVLQYDLQGNFIARYESGKKGAEATGEDAGYISYCCKNKIKKYKNSIWRFENEK